MGRGSSKRGARNYSTTLRSACARSVAGATSAECTVQHGTLQVHRRRRDLEANHRRWFATTQRTYLRDSGNEHKCSEDVPYRELRALSLRRWRLRSEEARV